MIIQLKKNSIYRDIGISLMFYNKNSDLILFFI